MKLSNVAQNASNGPTLFTFLGTGDYKAARYLHPDTGEELVETRFVSCALVRAFKPRAVKAFITAAAESQNGAAFRAALQEFGVSPEVILIPEGKTAEERWQFFSILAEHMQKTQGELVLDITHGFRALPFLAGAVAAYVRAFRTVGEQPSNETNNPFGIRIVYGAYEARESPPIGRQPSDDEPRPDTVSGADTACRVPRVPIWDFTVFLDVLDWAWAVHMFLATGRAADLVELVLAAYKKLVERKLAQGESPRSGLKGFAETLKAFSEELATVRIGSFLLSQGDGKPSTVERLYEALEKAEQELEDHLPPIKPLLLPLKQRLAPLRFKGQDLAGSKGQAPMAALASLYLQLDRFAETAIALREGWVNLFAEPAGARPGPGFDRQARVKAEQLLQSVVLGGEKQEKAVLQLRNDLEHGGFNAGPAKPAKIRRQLAKLYEAFRAARAPKVWLVTRHPGAREWARRRGIQADCVVEHLDVSQVRPGDTVIGTLPLHLAAAVCRAGARLFHLSIDVPPEQRGKELTADEMEAYGARLEEMFVQLRVANNSAAGGE